MYYIGVDLGTSSVKLVLMDADGVIVRSAVREYPLFMPHNGWSEQNPEDWWEGVCSGLKELLGDDGEEVAALSFSGQMHGLVVLDEQDRVIRPAILWNDGRTEQETAYLNETVGEERLAQYTANIAFAGFTAPKILWLAKHEPENFKRIKKIMLPKDYIAYRLSGVHCTDYSDASGMLLLDVEHKCWSQEMLQLCGITQAQLPTLYESRDVVGTVTAEASAMTGLPCHVRIVAGAGDNAAAAIGMGIVEDGMCNLSVGTSGTAFIATQRFVPTDNHTLHSFVHATGNYHLMGCILSAAACNQWWMQTILQTDAHSAEQAQITRLGENPVFFAPYLMGERSPHNDTSVRGAFVGLSLDTGRAEMLQAVMEGVAFALRDCVEVAKSVGVTINRMRICGGGAKSPLWTTIFANIMGMPIEILDTEDGAARGAAILALAGCCADISVQTLSLQNASVRTIVEPTEALVKKYEEGYRQFKKIYPLLRQF